MHRGVGVVHRVAVAAVCTHAQSAVLAGDGGARAAVGACRHSRGVGVADQLHGGDRGRCALVVGQHAARWVGACDGVDRATSLDGVGGVVAQGQGDGNGQRAVDGHGHIDQHLRLRGAVVIDLVGDVGAVDEDGDFAFVGPGNGQTGVAQGTGGGHTVGGQGGQVEGVASDALNHHLHFVGAAGGAGCSRSAGLRAGGGLIRASKAVRRHGAGSGADANGGAGVGSAQRQHVVGCHGQHRGALHLYDFNLLDASHGLVGGQGVQVEGCASGQREGVHARAATDHAAVCGECGLQAGARHCDGVVTFQCVQYTCGVSDRFCAVTTRDCDRCIVGSG